MSHFVSRVRIGYWGCTPTQNTNAHEESLHGGDAH